MRHLKSTLTGFLLLTLPACNAVVTEQPMGERPLTISAGDWEGTWIEGAALVTETADVYLREMGPWIVASVKTETDSESDQYVWARVKREGGQIVVWDPSVEKFKQLVEEGKLPGTVTEHGDVILGHLRAEHYDLITSGSEGVLFDWDEPGVILRIGR